MARLIIDCPLYKVAGRLGIVWQE